MTALKIPHEIRPFWHWFSDTSHGPNRTLPLWWPVRVKHYKVADDSEGYERLWVYTRWGAFFIDWSWA